MIRSATFMAAALAMLVAASGASRADDSRLATDEAVRREMKVVRDLTLNSHTLVTHRRMPPADAQKFHANVKAAVERLRAGLTLAEPARSEIEELAADILMGAQAVAGLAPSLTPIDGIMAIDSALAEYGKRFDDPGWQPLR